uniref:Uncharacterized protein n=1 Tax=uncultured marine virus TaxID=186617 RepID=A0A0F7L779_9VIRU|nr:hypothetical protein [uncultured marine virus]
MTKDMPIDKFFAGSTVEHEPQFPIRRIICKLENSLSIARRTRNTNRIPCVLHVISLSKSYLLNPFNRDRVGKSLKKVLISTTTITNPLINSSIFITLNHISNSFFWIIYNVLN